MIWVVLTIAAATVAGIWAERRSGPGAVELSRRSLMLVLYVLLPPVTFFNLARIEIDADLGIGIPLAYLALGGALAITYLAGTRLLRLDRPAIGAMLVCTLIANTGYLGYPLVAVLLGFDRLPEAVVYDVLVATPGLLVVAFSFGAAFGTEAGETTRERVRAFFARNPPLYAALLALVAPDVLAPDVLVDASRIAIIAMLPVGFFAVGTVLGQEADDGRLPFPPPIRPAVATTVAMRLLVAPALLLAIAAPLIDLPGAYLLLAAMPCGINSMVVAQAYGLDLRLTAEAVAWSTAIVVVGAAATSLL